MLTKEAKLLNTKYILRASFNVNFSSNLFAPSDPVSFHRFPESAENLRDRQTQKSPAVKLTLKGAHSILSHDFLKIVVEVRVPIHPSNTPFHTILEPKNRYLFLLFLLVST